MKIKRTIGYHVVTITSRETGDQIVLSAPVEEFIEVKGIKQLPLFFLDCMARVFGTSI